MDNNYFVTRDQYIFICYKDIIKLTYPVMLKEIIDEYYDDLLPYLELEHIKDYNIENLERLCIERITKNPLTYIKRPECTEEICDLLLNAFEDEFIDMYTQSRLTNFGSKLYTMFSLSNIKEIYIYSEKPIPQILIDCKVYFEEFDGKIKYVAGDFVDVVKCLDHQPTLYILNDADYIQRLIDNKLIAYSEVMLAELGYNYELDEEYNLVVKGEYEKHVEKEIFKLAYFPVINLTKKHFDCLKRVD